MTYQCGCGGEIKSHQYETKDGSLHVVHTCRGCGKRHKSVISLVTMGTPWTSEEHTPSPSGDSPRSVDTVSAALDRVRKAHDRQLKTLGELYGRQPEKPGDRR